jgi:hypothetical protein
MLDHASVPDHASGRLTGASRPVSAFSASCAALAGLPDI